MRPLLSSLPRIICLPNLRSVYVRDTAGKKRRERRSQRTFIAVHRDDLSTSPFLSRPALDLNSDQRA